MSHRLGSQWDPYRRLLVAALDAGYLVLSLDEWFHERPDAVERVLILRHDVDQQPGSALRMAAIESDLGLRSTWYFRWRTAHPQVVDALVGDGHAVGLHYETLTRAVLAAGGTRVADGLVERCREELRGEVAAFAQRHGPVRSICPHGDTRVPGVDNLVLLRGRDPADFGVAFDGNEVMRGQPLGAWVTDRPGGRTWKDEKDPRTLVAAGTTPVFAIMHPNNWTSRAHAVEDRILRRLLPNTERLARPLRSGSDRPPQ